MTDGLSDSNMFILWPFLSEFVSNLLLESKMLPESPLRPRLSKRLPLLFLSPLDFPVFFSVCGLSETVFEFAGCLFYGW